MSYKIIELYINDQLINFSGYNDKKARKKIMYRWEKIYPIRPNQKRYIIIKDAGY